MLSVFYVLNESINLFIVRSCQADTGRVLYTNIVNKIISYHIIFLMFFVYCIKGKKLTSWISIWWCLIETTVSIAFKSKCVYTIDKLKLLQSDCGTNFHDWFNQLHYSRCQIWTQSTSSNKLNNGRRSNSVAESSIFFFIYFHLYFISRIVWVMCAFRFYITRCEYTYVGQFRCEMCFCIGEQKRNKKKWTKNVWK